MYCPKCGSANSDGATFCASCGAAMSAPVIPASSPVPTFASPPPANYLMPPPQSVAAAPKSSRGLVPVLAALAVILVAGVVAYVLMSGRGLPPGGGTGAVATPTPKEYVSTYYQAILDKDWQKAFDMQPSQQKAGQTAQDFQTTQQQYGYEGYSIDSAVTGSTDATVVASIDLGDLGTWEATWLFSRQGDRWVAMSRKMGMGEGD